MSSEFVTTSLQIDCHTCLAGPSSACADCVVTHLLANSDRPIAYVPVRLRHSCQRAESDPDVALFHAAGLLDDPPRLVSAADFESAGRAASDAIR
jgi:hypothetical protein